MTAFTDECVVDGKKGQGGSEFFCGVFGAGFEETGGSVLSPGLEICVEAAWAGGAWYFESDIGTGTAE
jgi:hypothetical protein